MEIQIVLDWAMQNLPLAIGLLIGALLVVFLILYLVGKGHLSFLKPFIKEAIKQAEIHYLELGVGKMSEAKIAEVLNKVIAKRPILDFILPSATIKKLIAVLYKEIEEELVELKNSYLAKLG